jgi:hypothetical protein
MQKIPSHSHINFSPSSFLQPAPAWIAILVFILLTILGMFVGGGILNLAFPAMSLAVGGFLYFRHPILYISFTWWLWFLTPLVRRLVDYRSGYTNASPLLLAPYLVTAVTLVTVLQYLPQAYRRIDLSFIFPIAGVFYGFLIGMINHSFPLVVIREFLDWLTPLTFGFHLWVNWRNFPSYYQNIQRTFVWGILVMGIYGIFQFIALPEWDRLWVFNSNMIGATGTPSESGGGIRVWSTMTSGEPFAAFMAGGLLLLFTRPGALPLGASVAGYLALLLSTVRSAWIGWFAGLLILGSSLEAKHKKRLIVMALVIAGLVIPLATTGIFSEKITERFDTLSNLSEDGSAQIRQQAFVALIDKALTNFLGDGIGEGWLDSAFFALIFNLGWIGTICYVSGLFVLVLRIFQIPENSSDPFLGNARAIVVSCLLRIPVNGTAISGSGGLLLWGFLALALASHKYHQYLQEPTSTKAFRTV